MQLSQKNNTMFAASPIPRDLMSKHLQMQAQSDLDQARLYKAQYCDLHA